MLCVMSHWLPRERVESRPDVKLNRKLKSMSMKGIYLSRKMYVSLFGNVTQTQAESLVLD